MLIEIRFQNRKPVLFLRQPVFKFIFFSLMKLHKNYQMSDKSNHTFV